MKPGRISLTFDDGMLSTYSNVFPLMRERGLKGHIAVVTDRVGEDNHYTWDQIAEMAAGGWEIMSHSRSHDFKVMDEAKMLREVVESRSILQSRGYPALVFNNPGGSWSNEPRWLRGSAYEALVRRTYQAFLPDSGVHPMKGRVDPYMIGHLCCECYGTPQFDLPISKIIEALDQAASSGAWVQLLWHDVKGADLEKFRKTLAHLTPLVRSGKLLNVTVSEELGLK